MDLGNMKQITNVSQMKAQHKSFTIAKSKAHS